jgi:alpha-methylacyl-CoA racemase
MGRADSPPAPPLNLVGDYGGGTMFLVMGILAALHERQQSGQGQVIDAAITEGTANLMSLFYTLSDLGAWSSQRAANLLDSAAPFYDCYETADHKYVSLGSIEPHFYAQMIEKLELDEGVFGQQNDPRLWPAQKQTLASVIIEKTRDEWDQLLAGTDVCFAPVLDYVEAAGHPHMQARGVYLQQDGKLQPAPAPRFSRTPSTAGPLSTQAEPIDAIVSDWQ